MKPGSKVIIRWNPHNTQAENIIGTVIHFRPGEGFGGCDLVDVKYQDFQEGKETTMPFSIDLLEPAEPSTLIALAEHYEKKARELRQLAEGVANVKTD